MGDKSWYLKSRKASQNIQGPFSTVHIAKDIHKQKLKERVCFSADKVKWYEVGEVFSEKLEVIEIQERLGDIISYGEYQSEMKSKVQTKVIVSLITLCLVCIIVLMNIQKKQKKNEKRDIDNELEYKIQKKENEKIRKLKRMKEKIERKKREEKRKKEALKRKEEILKKQEQERYQRELEKKEQKIKEERRRRILALEKKRRDEYKKALLDQKRKGQLKKIEKIRLKEKYQKKKQRDIIYNGVMSYYQHLKNTAERKAKPGDVALNYRAFLRAVKTFEQFIKNKGLSSISEETLETFRQQNKNKYHAFIYPASVYKVYQKFLFFMDHKQMKKLTNDIERMERKFRPDILRKKKLEEKQISLKQELENLDFELRNVKYTLSHSPAQISRKQQDIIRLKSDIREYEYKQRKLEEKRNRIDEEIVSLKRKLLDTTDKEKRKKLQRSIHEKDREKGKLESEIETVLSNVRTSEEKLQRNKNELDELKEKYREAKRKKGEIESKIEKGKQEIKWCSRTIKEIEEKLRPLVDIRKRKKEILSAYSFVAKSWRNAYKKPRMNMLLAIYILQTFHKKYYRVKVNTGKAIYGTVDVYFW